MRVLLDESVPRNLAALLIGHIVLSVQQMGWSGLANGELLHRAAADGFSVLVTMDRSMEYQQNIARAGLGVVVLVARSNKVEDVLPLAPGVITALATLRAGQVIHVRA